MNIEANKKYIVRAVDAGVFYGYIVEKEGSEVTMADARCLWYWEGAASLNQLASEGAKHPDKCKFTMALNQVTILNVCEIIPCTDEAVDSIDGVKVWQV